MAVYIAYSKLFEAFLVMESSNQPCTYQELEEAVTFHTGYKFNDLIRKGYGQAPTAQNFATYKEFWVAELSSALLSRLAGPDPISNIAPGQGWQSLDHREFDHLTKIFEKDDLVSNLRVQAKQSSGGIVKLLLEAAKTVPTHSLCHDRPGSGGRTQEEYHQLLQYEPVLDYSFLGGVVRPGKYPLIY